MDCITDITDLLNLLTFKPLEKTKPMNLQYIVNPVGERISVIIPIAEYEALLSSAVGDETAFLLREPNGSILLQRIDNIRQGRNIIERELLPDEN